MFLKSLVTTEGAATVLTLFVDPHIAALGENSLQVEKLTPDESYIILATTEFFPPKPYTTVAFALFFGHGDQELA